MLFLFPMQGNGRIFKQHYLEKDCWNVLKWVTGHCNRAAVSRNRYGVEKTVDTHKILNVKQEDNQLF
jgi:hypothetical protein